MTNDAISDASEDIPKKGLRKVRGWGLWINLATFLIGYATGVIAGALLYIRDDINLSNTQQGFATSILLLGATAAAMVTGGLAEKFGRKIMLGAAGVLFAIGFALAALAPGFWLLILGRLITGLWVGVGSVLGRKYLSVICPVEIRGWSFALYQSLLTFGMMVACVVKVMFAPYANWRAMFCLGAVHPVLHVVLTLRLSDSSSRLINQCQIEI